jgi:hypothetical protein
MTDLTPLVVTDRAFSAKAHGQAINKLFSYNAAE